MFENPRRGRQARNFTTNVPKILDLKSSSKQIFSKNWRWVPLSHFMVRLFNIFLFCCWGKKRSRLLRTLRCLTEELQLSTLFIFKGLFIIFLHGLPPPHQYRWLESECSIFVWMCPLKNEIWRTNFFVCTFKCLRGPILPASLKTILSYSIQKSLVLGGWGMDEEWNVPKWWFQQSTNINHKGLQSITNEYDG